MVYAKISRNTEYERISLSRNKNTDANTWKTCKNMNLIVKHMHAYTRVFERWQRDEILCIIVILALRIATGKLYQAKHTA